MLSYEEMIQMNDCIRHKSQGDFCIMDCITTAETKCIIHNVGDIIKPVLACDCVSCIKKYIESEDCENENG